MDDSFSPTNYFSLLESYQLHIIASNCCKIVKCSIEVLIQRCSVKKVFLKVLENSQVKPCARVSFLIML